MRWGRENESRMRKGTPRKSKVRQGKQVWLRMKLLRSRVKFGKQIRLRAKVVMSREVRQDRSKVRKEGQGRS